MKLPCKNCDFQILDASCRHLAVKMFCKVYLFRVSPLSYDIQKEWFLFYFLVCQMFIFLIHKNSRNQILVFELQIKRNRNRTNKSPKNKRTNVTERTNERMKEAVKQLWAGPRKIWNEGEGARRETTFCR